ncbi:hypothetical protein GQ54DRAFT_316425 [Martensiomyces pterosporus]|nr:hypothetical protein GQ54DRAFT_316425 [Martensiomyces pterosporus]
MEAVEHQARVEALAEDVLTDKQLSVDYDRKRQENREALRQLRKQAQQIKPTSSQATTALNMGDFFIQVPTSKAQAMVEGAQRELEEAIGEVQVRLKKKVQLLGELEGDAHTASVMRSMNMKSISGEDLYSITKN